jgi:hypothetical protein
MDVQNLGTTIRQFLRDLFGSRLNAHLEEELMRTRQDFENRLMDRERVIADQREELGQLKAKVDRYEMVLLPLSSPAGGFFAPRKPRPPLHPTDPEFKSWPQIQAEWDKEQAEIAAKEKAAQ